VASPGQGVWVSKRVSERAETTPFTSELRGELDRARFVSVSQPDLDRVFDLTMGKGEGLRHLIVEMMPPGNIVVTDGASLVTTLEKEVRTTSRRIVKGGKYAPPLQRRASPSTVTVAEIADAIRQEKTAGKAVGKHVALPGKYVQEILRRLSVEEGSPANDLEGREEEISAALRGIIREAEEKPAPCICESASGSEIFAIRPTSMGVTKQSESLSELCDEVLLGQVSEDVAVPMDPDEGRRREIEVTVAKLAVQESSLRAQSSDTRMMAAKAQAADSVEGAVTLLDGVGISPRSRPASQSAVASLLYDRAKELERKADEARDASTELSKKRDRLKPKPGTRMKELKRGKKEWYEKFRWFFTGGGKLAIGGRDSQSNSLLIRRHLDSNDTVYHADLFGSPFFLLKGGRDQTPTEVAEVAQATAAFSSAWKTGLGMADAYWVNPDQVGTSAPSGEYLPKGSFLMKGKKNFVPQNLVEVAVGVDSVGRVISGSEGALSHTAVCYLVVRPHREKSSETAKRVKKDLEAMGGEAFRAPLQLDDIARALPAGGGKIVRKGRRAFGLGP